MSIRVGGIPNGIGHVKELNILVQQSGLTDELYVLLEKIRPHWNREQIKYVVSLVFKYFCMYGFLYKCDELLIMRLVMYKCDFLIANQ